MGWRPSLSQVLSTNAGYVDTIGFLALHGLFTAHVTGNFVTLGAAIVQGTSGAAAKLLALPVFCAGVILVRLWNLGLAARGRRVLPRMLVLETVLLVVAAIVAIACGPFPEGDHAMAVLTGMTLVSAMAIQNAVQRLHLASAPPTTLMTGTTTQVMIDIADLMKGLPAPAADAARGRVLRMSGAVAAFAFGCAAAACAYIYLDLWCLVVPPLLAALSVAIQSTTHEGDPTPASTSGNQPPSAPSART